MFDDFRPFIPSLPSFHEIDEKNVLHDAVEHFVEHSALFQKSVLPKKWMVSEFEGMLWGCLKWWEFPLLSWLCLRPWGLAFFRALGLALGTRACLYEAVRKLFFFQDFPPQWRWGFVHEPNARRKGRKNNGCASPVVSGGDGLTFHAEE